MKSGRSLQELAAELERQSASKKDYIAPQGLIAAVPVENGVELTGLNGAPVRVSNHAHGQLGDHLGIPKKYYDRMRAETPDLLAANINRWLAKDADNKRMIRTLDGEARAFMSHKYRPLDNFDLAQSVIPVLIKARAKIVSCELTETRMYIKAILPELSDVIPTGELGVGHTGVDRGTVVSAIVIANSEVGAGTLRVEPSVFTTFCTNLAILAEAAMKKYHVGRSFDADANFEVFRDETRKADDRAFWLKVQDVTRAAFDEKIFRAAIADMKKSAQNPIVSRELPKVVEVAVKRLALPESTSGSILTHLAAGGDLTQWGLSSAVTRVANDFDDYEGATELERAGGKIIALSPSDWKVISEAGVGA
jgi:hypothetical protein